MKESSNTPLPIPPPPSTYPPPYPPAGKKEGNAATVSGTLKSFNCFDGNGAQKVSAVWPHTHIYSGRTCISERPSWARDNC